MKRYNDISMAFEDSPKKVEDFISEIETISKKYGLSIAHEDSGGNFRIDYYKVENIEWLRDATMKIQNS